MADLNELLAKIEEASERLGPKVVEGREVIQDLKTALTEAKEELRKFHRQEVRELIQAELDNLVPELRELKRRLREMVEVEARKTVEVLEEVRAAYGRMLVRYDEVEAELKRRDYAGSIQLPVPPERGRELRRKL